MLYRHRISVLLGLCLLILILGTYVAVVSIHPGVSSAITGYSPVDLTQDEKQWVADHPVVLVCPDSSYPPFELITNDGEYQGIAADLLREIAKNTGFTLGVTYETNWGNCVENIKTGKSDLLGAVYISNLRSDYLIYSEPYYRSLLPIITRGTYGTGMTLNQFSGKRVASVRGFTTTLLLKEQYPDIHVVEVPDVKAGLESVSLGDADAYFGDLAASTYYVKEEGMSNLHVAGAYKPQNPDDFSYAFGVSKNDPELVGIINKGLHAIPQKKQEEIFRRWISPDLAYPQIDPFFLLIVTGAFGVLLLLVGLFILWNRTLRRLVEEKTRDLSQELSEHKKTSEHLLITRFTVDHSHAMMLWLDGGGAIRDMNETLCTDTGYTREELLGSRLSILDTGISEETQQELLGRVKKEGRIRVEHRIKTKTGEIFPVETVLYYFTYEGKEWLCAETQSISERQENERVLRESEQKYRDLFQNVTDAIFFFALSPEGTPGRILEVNEVAEHLTGYSHDHLCSMEYQNLGNSPGHEICMTEPLLTPHQRCTYEWEIIRGSGEIIPVEVNLHVFEREGTPFGLSLIHDITERRLHEAERETAISQIQKNLAELSMLNDGVRNPLSIIMGAVEIFCSEKGDIINEQVNRIDEMIKQLDIRWNESEKILQYLKKHHDVVIPKHQMSEDNEEGGADLP